MSMETPLTPQQNRFITGWLPQTHGVAKSFWERSGKTLPLDELISIAYQGLVKAAQKFDPSRPDNDENYDPYLGFGNYSKQVVAGAILDWQRSQDHVPRRQRDTYKSLLENGYGAGKSPEELAPIIGMAPDKIRSIVAAVEASGVSFDNAWDEHADPGRKPEALLPTDSYRLSMSQVLNSMPIAQRSVIALRYYYGHEFPQIAAELEISQPLARVLHDEALMVLRSVLTFARDT
jgi:RNA polymerase sigma factor (sigma-70 family)